MNKDKRNNIKLLGTLNNADESGIIANASQIYDGVAQKSVEERITDLDHKIESAVAAETSRAQEAEANRYTKNETYTKEELNNLITTPNQEYVSVTATDQTTAVTDVLPAIGLADTVYRVGSWDGSQYDVAMYSEYAWNGKDYVYLSTKTEIGDVFDISAYHATGGTLATYDNLEDALGTNGKNIPQSLRKGGMSVKFVQSSDNKYVQYRLMSDTFNTNVTDWQGVDDEPIAESNNLVKSGGVYAKIKALEDAGYVFAGIATPTTNPGTPDGNVFYIAGEGTYVNFSGLVIDTGQLGILKWNGTWSKQVLELGASGGSMILDWNTDVSTTRKQVLSKYRKPGVQISYINEDNDGSWVNEQYIGTSITDTEWIKDTNWEAIPNQKQLTELKNSVVELGQCVDGRSKETVISFQSQWQSVLINTIHSGTYVQSNRNLRLISDNNVITSLYANKKTLLESDVNKVVNPESAGDTVLTVFYNGTSIEQKIEDLSNKIDLKPNYPIGKNLYNKDTERSESTSSFGSAIIVGYRTHIDKNDGLRKFVKDSTRFLSNYIPIKPNTQYTCSKSLETLEKVKTLDSEFNETNNGIDGSTGYLKNTFTSGANDAYIFIQASIDDIETFSLQEGKKAEAGTSHYSEIASLYDLELLEKKRGNVLYNFSLLLLGDSYSDFGQWVQQLQNIIKIRKLINLAKAQCTLKDKSNDRITNPYSSRPNNTDINGNVISSQIEKLKRLMLGVDLDNGEEKIYTDENDYPDVIIIEASTNDNMDSEDTVQNWKQQIATKKENVYIKRYKTITQDYCYLPTPIEDIDRTCFVGAMRYHYEALHKIFPKAKIFYITPTNLSYAQRRFEEHPYKAQQVMDAGRMLGIPVIDWTKYVQMTYMDNCKITGDGTQGNPYILTNSSEDSTDGLHPNENGGYKLAKVVAFFIRYFS